MSVTDETLIPLQVPPYAFAVVPQVCALGAARAVGGHIVWPSTVVGEAGDVLVETVVHARVGEMGPCVCYAPRMAAGVDAALVIAGVKQALSEWAAAVSAGRGVPGPFAPVMGAYFDLVVTDNGLSGVDAWGRAVVRDATGREVAYAPEQRRPGEEARDASWRPAGS